MRAARLAVIVLALVAGAGHALAESGLPAGAVIAFVPGTVCEKLPGGWKRFADADGRVIVGAMPGVPASGPQAALPIEPPPPPPAPGAPPPIVLKPPPAPPINPPDYWAANPSLAPGMIPRQTLAGAGQIVVTAPVVSVTAPVAAKGGTTYRLYGYQTAPAREPGAESLAVGYGAPGTVGKDPPDPIQVAPPFVALPLCVKQ
ncbi:hypothetical protein ACO2Q3_16475 [Caulobacter sp. KR2-114]|uniref:hypothetical protein n=1 Tax=Caulobacter sp. KR2-114 TaxID=3400912 RepID=UPI003C104B65